MRPLAGHLLVSRLAERVELAVSVVPGRAELVCPTHDRAIAKAQELARQRHVDVWLTEGHIHVLKVASYRGGDRKTAG
jgi:hypothetical protein